MGWSVITMTYQCKMCHVRGLFETRAVHIECNNPVWTNRGSSWGDKGYARVKYGVSSIGDGAAYVVIDGMSEWKFPSPSPRPSASPWNGPSNNQCTQAVSLGTMMIGNVVVQGSTARALPNSLDGCSATPTSGLAVWYTIDIQNSNVQISTFGSTYDTQLSIFRGNCSSRVCLAKNDDANGQITSRISLTDSVRIGSLLIAIHDVHIKYFYMWMHRLRFTQWHVSAYRIVRTNLSVTIYTPERATVWYTKRFKHRRSPSRRGCIAHQTRMWIVCYIHDVIDGLHCCPLSWTWHLVHYGCSSVVHALFIRLRYVV